MSAASSIAPWRRGRGVAANGACAAVRGANPPGLTFLRRPGSAIVDLTGTARRPGWASQKPLYVSLKAFSHNQDP